MSEPRAIVFDFDGVILESTTIKTRAFATLFADRPEHVEAVVQLHLDYVGTSRFEKFELIYERILGLPLSTEERAQLGQRFSALVYDSLLGCDFVPGAREFLGSTAGRLLLYVASATPEDELRRIVQARDLERWFDGVYGAPRTKANIVRCILQEAELGPEDVVFIGDAAADLEAARATGARFIGRVHGGESNPFAGEDVPIVRDLHALLDAWPRIAEVDAALR